MLKYSYVGSAPERLFVTAYGTSVRRRRVKENKDLCNSLVLKVSELFPTQPLCRESLRDQGLPEPYWTLVPKIRPNIMEIQAIED